MTREELTRAFLSSKTSNFVLQLPTSYGKSKLALQKVEQWYHEKCNILIVIPRNVLINNWKEEIVKWKYNKYLPNVTFTTYVSLHKHCDKVWDAVILDEGHHLSERCRTIMTGLRFKHIIVLSATLKKDLLFYFTHTFKTEVFHIKVKDAIDADVLPDPKIILIPLDLNNRIANQVIEKNMKKGALGSVKIIPFSEKWKYRSYKGPLKITCTPRQYYNDVSNLIEWYKERGKYSAIMRNMWLHKAGDRLKWLALQKELIVKDLLRELRNFRTLVYCPSIEDSLKIGSPCINSKVGTGNLFLFNEKKIKHIAAVGMLDEGMNLVDCKVGIFKMINSSDRLNIQRQGRLLRHKSPVLIFPYFVDTREQEIMEEITKDYNPELIVRLSPSLLTNIKKWL